MDHSKCKPTVTVLTRQPDESDETYRIVLFANRRAWVETAARMFANAALTRSKDHYETFREIILSADVYVRAAEALNLEIVTGKRHCTVCLQPIEDSPKGSSDYSGEHEK
jgi:hypothetical protein